MARRRLTPARPGYLAPVADEPASDTPRTGLASPPIAQVAGEASGLSALRELSEAMESARREGRMIVEVATQGIAADHLLRDRLSWDREEMDTLKRSIDKHGQRTPIELVVLPEGSAAEYGLISGWRRLQAIRELHDETGADRFASIRALVRPPEEATDSYVAMIEENEIRVGLSYYERARLAHELARQGVYADQGAALRALFGTASRSKRSKIGSFMQLHEDLGRHLKFPAEIGERLGLALVSRLRHGDMSRIRATLSKAEVQTAEEELALLEKLATPPKQKPDVSRAKQEAEKLAEGLSLSAVRKGGKITLTLSGRDVDDALLEKARAMLRGLTG